MFTQKYSTNSILLAVKWKKNLNDNFDWIRCQVCVYCYSAVLLNLQNNFLLLSLFRCRWTQRLYSGKCNGDGKQIQSHKRLRKGATKGNALLHSLPCATTTTYRYASKMPSHSISCAMMLLCTHYTLYGDWIYSVRVTLPLYATLIGNGIEKCSENKKGAIVLKRHTSKYLYETMLIARHITTETQTKKYIWCHQNDLQWLDMIFHFFF